MTRTFTSNLHRVHRVYSLRLRELVASTLRQRRMVTDANRVLGEHAHKLFIGDPPTAPELRSLDDAPPRVVGLVNDILDIQMTKTVDQIAAHHFSFGLVGSLHDPAAYGLLDEFENKCHHFSAEQKERCLLELRDVMFFRGIIVAVVSEEA